ncbi:DUF6683 family protein [Deinococcus roseus]|uniref:Uncharacterized protein n=1 Tax=Deinococcus roseus TaxID=392414 RepID=A0ABQ2D0M9_9DEIO|nr:DUF6683 family protein [Deinococcus roseus]GGJ39728.1 hypothetical protein GCM10008938_27170 [Deinococcus roseus]
MRFRPFRPNFTIKQIFTTGLLLLGTFAAPVFAEDSQFAGGLGGSIGNPIGNTEGQGVLNNLNRDNMFGRQGQSEGGRTNSNTQTPTGTSTQTDIAKSLDAGFKAGPYIYPQKLAATLTNLDASQQQQATGIFEQLLQVYDQQVAVQDTRLKNNVVGAMVYSTYVSTFVLTGVELSEAQQEGLFAALNRTFLSDPSFAAMNDATRQELYEALIITASFALGTYANSAGDFSQLEIAETLSAYLIQTIFQHDIDELQFTSEGVNLVQASFM